MNKKTIKDAGGDQSPPRKDMPVKINPEIKAILERVMERAGEEVQAEAVKQASEAREMVAPGGKFPPVQESLFKWAGFPTDMTRVSPFFPLNVKDRLTSLFKGSLCNHGSSLGKLLTLAQNCSTYEEDSLLVLLACLRWTVNTAQNNRQRCRKTYTYRGPAFFSRPSDICCRHKDYKRLIESCGF